MKKITASALAIMGVVFWGLGLYTIYAIYLVTREVNSQPEPPSTVMVIKDLPYCNCDISNGLAWNLVAVFMSMGAIFVVAGILMYRLVTRKGM